MIAMPTHPMHAEIVVEYRRGPPERYDATIHPHDPLHVRVDVRGPAPDEAHGAICRWAGSGPGSVATVAVQGLIECLFGALKATPRIVGTPDWSRVSLDLSAMRGSHVRRLLHVELTAQSANRAALVMRTSATSLNDESIVLCPEDADALYAITRLAMLSRAAAAIEPMASTETSMSSRPMQRLAAAATAH